MEDQLTKAAVEGAVKGVVENLGPFLKYLEELVTGYFYRKEKKRNSLKCSLAISTTLLTCLPNRPIN